MRPVLRLSAAALAAVLFLTATARAQEAVPLQKSDLVRFLSGTTYTKAEVAAIIRTSCLSFVPSVRDRADLRALGADDGVMAAIDACVSGGGLELRIPQSIVTAPVGGSVSIGVDLRRGSGPAAGIRLALLGSGSIRGGSGRDVAAVTNESGRASFEVRTGTRAGSYDLTVDAGRESVRGSRAITLRVTAGAATGVTSDPQSIVAGAEMTPIRVVARDRFGNAVPGVRLEGRADDAAGGRVLFSGQTAASGALSAALSGASLRGVERIVVVSGGSQVGTIPVRPGAQAPALLTIASGGQQSADRGTPLPEPVVVEVRDSSGAPVAGVAVQFSVDNGEVSPEAVRTDEAGRASAAVRVGGAGTETVLTAAAADRSVSVRFPISRGGMTPAQIAASLDEARSLVDRGDAGGARALYQRIVAADPTNLDARVGIAESSLVAGRYETAVSEYRSVLRLAPSRLDAQLGMARASFGAGKADEAARWYELALSQNRTDPDVWAALGDARAAAGERDEARDAYDQALSLDAQHGPALRGLDRLRTSPTVAELEAWGGYTDGNGRDPGVRWLEVRVYPVAGLEAWGTYDNSLNFRHPYLVRGRDDIKAGYGGTALAWGPRRSLRTSFEIGRRSKPPEETIQTTWTLEQGVRVGETSWIRLGGWLGHWWDRDDWVAFAGADVTAGTELIVRPTLSFGKYFGSNITESPVSADVHEPSREIRVGLAARYQSPMGWGIEPGVAYGNVSDAPDPELEGSLLDATTRLWYAFSPWFTVDSFVRYQSPPGTPSFWVVALRIQLGLKRSGG